MILDRLFITRWTIESLVIFSNIVPIPLKQLVLLFTSPYSFILIHNLLYYSHNLLSSTNALIYYIHIILDHIHISQPSAGFGWSETSGYYSTREAPSNPHLQIRLLKGCIETTMYYDIIFKKGLWEIAYTTAKGPLYYQALGFSLPILSLKRAYVAQLVM